MSEVVTAGRDGGPAAPGVVTCRVVHAADEVAAHHRIRHNVFVQEQGMFEVSDLDAHDARVDVQRVLAWWGSEPVGTVRLFPLEEAPGLWQGDRLAVLPAYRSGVGASLVRFALARAAASGGTRMIAHVQRPNRHFFERLGWHWERTETYVGQPHLVMTIALGSA